MLQTFIKAGCRNYVAITFSLCKTTISEETHINKENMSIKTLGTNKGYTDKPYDRNVTLLRTILCTLSSIVITKTRQIIS